MASGEDADDSGDAAGDARPGARRLGWWARHRWVGVSLVLLFTGLAPAPPQLPPRPPDEFRQEDDDPMDSLPSIPSEFLVEQATRPTD